MVENNHIHHIGGTSPQFGIDNEGAGRADRNILIYRNAFHDNVGGDFVTSSGRNVWVEENTMTQCSANAQGKYDPAVACDLEKQVDGPIIIWKETDNVIINNEIRMSKPTVNGFYGILSYVGSQSKSATRTNPVGNYIAGDTNARRDADAYDYTTWGLDKVGSWPRSHTVEAVGSFSISGAAKAS